MEIICPATLYHHCDCGLLAMHVCSPATALSHPVAFTVIGVVAVGSVGIEGESVDDAIGGSDSRTGGRKPKCLYKCKAGVCEHSERTKWAVM